MPHHHAAFPSIGLKGLVSAGTLSLLTLISHPALADSAYQKGPNPTVSSLEASGPWAVGSAKLPTSAEYGSATTVLYPKDRSAGSFGLVVLCPGFVSTAAIYQNLATRIASHGFVVATVSTNSLFDQPNKRAPQMIAVMKAVLAQNSVSAVAYAGQIDAQRVAFMGHSAGGSGTFYAAASNPQLKALVGLMPGEPSTNLTPFAGIRIPTLLLTAENDSIANSWARPYFKSLDTSLPAALIELDGANHLAVWNTASQATLGRVGKYATAWVKRFVDEDTRYTPFVKASAPDMSAFETKGSY